MAPEVALGKPYNENVDVYSFSLLLWQILKLATPYNGFSAAQLRSNVYNGNVRPKMDLSWPRSIRTILKSGWSGQFDRPSIAEMVLILRIECGLEDPVEVSRRGGDVSQSFISAINLGYEAYNTTPDAAMPAANEEPDETAVNDECDGEAATPEDEQLLDYATAEESDMPTFSFIAGADLPQLLRAGNNNKCEADDDDELAPQMFPFQSSGHLAI